ncbi:MAG: cold adaptation protein AtcC [Parashewanella sp.]
MTATMNDSSANDIVLRDPNQAPFLTKVLRFAAEEAILSAEDIEQIKHKGVLMSLKLADKFYNQYKMHLLEQASQDVIGVVSLGLAELTQHDQVKAILLLKKPDGLVKSFQKGWTMLASVSKYKLIHSKSVYGEVDQMLMEQVSAPVDADEWLGWDCYESAVKEHHSQQASEALKSLFFVNSIFDPMECQSIEEMFAEAIIYRLFFGVTSKVKEDLKRRIAEVNIDAQWLEAEYISQVVDKTLSNLPEQLEQTIRADLNPKFSQAICRTINFAQQYQKQIQQGATPEKLERLEHKHAVNGLLGWPHYLYL